MDAAPSVSICVPASRPGAHFRRAVRSLLAQEHEDLEIVVTDDTGGELAEESGRFGDPRVRYFANPPPGMPGNHLEGLRCARGRYLGVLREVDRALPTHVGSMVERFEADPSVGVVIGGCWVDDGVTWGRPAKALAAGRHQRFLHQIIRHDPFPPSATMVRREVWDEGSQSWPELALGHLGLLVEAALSGWSFFCLDEPLAVCRPGHAHDEDLIRFWERQRFADPEAEALRRRRLARCLVAQAADDLRSGRAPAAREHLRRARGHDARVFPPPAAVLRLLAAKPRAMPVARVLWPWLDPPPPPALAEWIHFDPSGS